MWPKRELWPLGKSQHTLAGDIDGWLIGLWNGTAGGATVSQGYSHAPCLSIAETHSVRGNGGARLCGDGHLAGGHPAALHCRPVRAGGADAPAGRGGGKPRSPGCGRPIPFRGHGPWRCGAGRQFRAGLRPLPASGGGCPAGGGRRSDGLGQRLVAPRHAQRDGKRLDRHDVVFGPALRRRPAGAGGGSGGEPAGGALGDARRVALSAAGAPGAGRVRAVRRGGVCLCPGPALAESVSAGNRPCRGA